MAESTNDGPVVVGIDGSDAGFEALRHAAREARWRDVPLHVVHVLDVTPAVLHLKGDQAITTRELAESDREEIWRRAEEVIDLAAPNVAQVERDGNPGDALIAYCDEVGASVLVVGPRGRGRVATALLGSTAQETVKAARCDVLVVKSR
jgi:nucleotide-binding universal stress UspA family protein